ncbi:hypothetical protein ACGC1H_002700 [Rhizoctonia solani]
MIQLSFPFIAAMVGVLSQIALAVPSAKHPASCVFPNPPSSKNVVYKHPYIVRANEHFDGQSHGFYTANNADSPGGLQARTSAIVVV